MTKLVTIHDIQAIIGKVGILDFFRQLIDRLESDYARWDDFYKSPRHAIHYPHGVMELMPTSDDDYYTYKFVNGHPNNPIDNKMTVVALGMLAEVKNGYPLMLSEMTLLTALRTAATSALAAKFMAKSQSETLAMIGTGSQAEFQTLAMKAIFPIKTVRYFDIDTAAMEKFAANMAEYDIKLMPCKSAEETVSGCDIITTATADKKASRILQQAWIQPGMHINGVGGDCPGKTELDPALLSKAKIVIEFLPQTKVEGEIQNTGNNAIYAEMWELASKQKPGRENDEEITIFDSVGFALEDYSVLRLIYDLAKQQHVGESINMIPSLSNPKDLFLLLK